MLYEEFSTVENSFLGKGHFQNLLRNSTHVTENLRHGIELREYQKDAFGRFLFFLDDYKNKQHPYHLLFNMATGSGKTVIMAAAILELYNRGYRDFIFFTRLGNIVDKTILNFLTEQSSKYLFAKPIRFGSKSVQINRVTNFEGASLNDINLMMTTTSNLHDKLNTPMENTLSFEGLKSRKLVLIADEAHNLTADTRKKLSAEELKNITSWESTVMRLLSSNPQSNILLEFTATARLDAEYPEVVEKYKDKAIVRYDLKQFRMDGYSKDVSTLEVDAPILERALVAMVISQFRLKVAESNGLRIKPVVLFKSNRVSKPSTIDSAPTLQDESIVVSSIFKEQFHQYVSSLEASHIDALSKYDSDLVSTALRFFAEVGLSSEQLAAEIRRDFDQVFCLTVDDDEDVEKKQLLLNSLEDSTNRIRAVFATQKLNEGWDVLNLFDIVRLYNSRDASKNRAGKTTVEEAQLIGRGARYLPFDWGDDLPKNKRKFDSDTTNPLRILEELVYHSRTNPRYIQELRSALTETGIMAEASVTRSLVVKPEIRNSSFWKETHVYLNSRHKKLTTNIFSLADAEVVFDSTLSSNVFALPTRRTRQTSVFDNQAEPFLENTVETVTIPVAALGSHVIRTALWDLPNGSFQSLKALFGGLESLESFIADKEYLGGLQVSVSGAKEQINALLQSEKRELARFIVGRILESARSESSEFEGSREFKPIALDVVFGQEKSIKLDEYGERSRPVSDVDLASADWFAQNEIWGTSEEKDFISFMKVAVGQLQDRYENVLLIRNEMQFPIYSFRAGEAFYPDFVLFVKVAGSSQNLVYQVIIEPKGDQFLDADSTFVNSKEGWKQEFLEELESNAEIVVAGEKYRLIGLPFFNAGKTAPAMRERFTVGFGRLVDL
jgi:type III restriction enzyme